MTVTIADFPYHYFVSYAQALGFGNMRIDTREPVTEYDAVEEFHRTICRARDLPSNAVAVLGYQLLSGPADEDARLAIAERALTEIRSMVAQFDTPRDAGRVRAFVGDVGQVAARGLGEAGRG